MAGRKGDQGSKGKIAKGMDEAGRGEVGKAGGEAAKGEHGHGADPGKLAQGMAEAGSGTAPGGGKGAHRLLGGCGRCGVAPELEEVVRRVGEPPFRPRCGPAAA